MPGDDVRSDFVRKVENVFHALDFFGVGRFIGEPADFAADGGNGQVMCFDGGAFLQKFVPGHRIRRAEPHLKSVSAKFNRFVQALLKGKLERFQHNANWKMFHK